MLLLLATVALAGDPKFGAQNQPLPTGELASTAHLAGYLWRHLLSPGDGPRCRFHPTCSAYALQAVDRDGPLLALPEIFDRLSREPDASAYPADGDHFLDPLSDHAPPSHLWRP